MVKLGFGSEFKVNVHVDEMNGLHMEDYDFKMCLYCFRDKSVVYDKSSAAVKKVDADNYIVCVSSDDSRILGIGAVKLDFTAYLPDADFDDGLRSEIVNGICVGVMIQ